MHWALDVLAGFLGVIVGIVVSDAALRLCGVIRDDAFGGRSDTE